MTEDQKRPPEAVETENLDAGSPESEVLEEAAEAQNREPDAETRIAELEGEVTALKDQVLRAHAEMENVRKRSQKEIVDARTYAVEKFAGDLLSVSDNLARALAALPDDEREALTEAGQNLLGGVEMTQKELHAKLAKHGVTAIDAEPGATFDPNKHEAVSQIPSQHPSGTIAETFQSGWKIGDRTLRAAIVAVSSGPAN
ncbi:nucleotide exchange factor GrpE [Henriciella algicola]|uniref:Protein GrpE n=1 Tax=Henriciella algicola TaxID=1608422 RepID=A0A399R8C7_9PROT|nr:nucleotide exchange factor GrpE [Henriciella algicola]RIJ27660.1 nucleotide exchange factor GrpE [Henriciella algicola]|tara:strand:- start:895 stop:1494 length:600 start_codon:yes stop_codon:yes gene_type:complete